MSDPSRVGIFGRPQDPHLIALRRQLSERGIQVLQLDSQGLNNGQSWTFDGQSHLIDGQRCADIVAWHLRHLMAPLPPAMKSSHEHVLYADWYVDYMQRREKQALQLSLFEQVRRAGVTVVNAPGPAGATQLKSLQLAAAREIGLAIPATCTTNHPGQARDFFRVHPGCVIKPSIGGGPCQLLQDRHLLALEQARGAPVTLQQRVVGRQLRVTWVGQDPVVTVAFSSDAVDLRQDPHYLSGDLEFTAISLDPSLETRCRRLLQLLDLQLAGIDLIEDSTGQVHFLEANPSPVYLDIEDRTAVSVSAAIAELMLGDRPRGQAYEHPRAAVAYALPFAPDTQIGEL